MVCMSRMGGKTEDGLFGGRPGGGELVETDDDLSGERRRVSGDGRGVGWSPRGICHTIPDAVYSMYEKEYNTFSHDTPMVGLDHYVVIGLEPSIRSDTFTKEIRQRYNNE